jgi:uncharacterized surface protein with fasciclin (FAS1) repeats
MKKINRLAALGSVAALAVGSLATAAPATAGSGTGNRSLATVLTSDHNRFDKRSGDFDVVTEAVLAVLEAKPDSPVAALTQGRQRLTAFVPTDGAFRTLVYDLTGKWRVKERRVFNTVAGLGIDTVETVLLYHVVPGAKITAKRALAADGTDVTTAQGGTVSVDVLNPRSGRIRLQDADMDDVDPRTKPRLLNINKGNQQIAHGIDQVLRPVDL